MRWRRGVHVVSASKRVVSACRTALAEAAEAGGGRLLHSAAVGGGAPVLETVAEARARGDVTGVDGILNGTVNYILERLGRGAAFARRSPKPASPASPRRIRPRISAAPTPPPSCG